MIRGDQRYPGRFLLSEYPREIDKLHNFVINLQRPNRPHVPAISDVDIAV